MFALGLRATLAAQMLEVILKLGRYNSGLRIFMKHCLKTLLSAAVITLIIPALSFAESGDSNSASLPPFKLSSKGCPQAHCDLAGSDNLRMSPPLGKIQAIAHDTVPTGGGGFGLGCSSNGTYVACAYSTKGSNLAVYDADGNVLFRSPSNPSAPGYLNSTIGAPIVSKSNHIIAADNTKLIRYDLSGNILWQTLTPESTIPLSPVLIPRLNVVVLATAEGPVSVYSVEDGHLIGSLTVTDSSGAQFDTINTPAISGNRMYVSMAKRNDPMHTGWLVAIKVDPSNTQEPLKVIWHYTFGGPSGASPDYKDGVVYFDGDREAPCTIAECSNSPTLFAVRDAGQKPELVWKKRVPTVVLASGALDPRGTGIWYFSLLVPTIQLYDLKTGAILKTIDVNLAVGEWFFYHVPSSVMNIAPGPDGQPVMFVSASSILGAPSYVTAINLETGKLLWKFKVAQNFYTDWVVSQFAIAKNSSGKPRLVFPTYNSGAYFIGKKQ